MFFYELPDLVALSDTKSNEMTPKFESQSDEKNLSCILPFHNSKGVAALNFQVLKTAFSLTYNISSFYKILGQQYSQ